MSLYLTFDIGTTALKTGLFNVEGRLLALHTAEYTPQSPQPGWAEMAPETYWDAVVEGTRAVFALSGADRHALTAIGFSSQGQTFIPIDRSGQPLYDAIIWVDNRAQEIADDWQATWLTPDDFRRISGYPWVTASLTVFKIAWLAKYAPAVHQAWKYLCIPDYLIYRLTGEIATDYVTARMAGLLDLKSGNWHPRLLDAAGITSVQLPAVLHPGTVAGEVLSPASEALGIPVGIPVCVGTNDQLAGALGAGNVRPGIVTETTGSALTLIATTPTLIDDRNLVVGRHAIPGLSYAMSFNFTSAIVLKWLRDICSPGEDYEAFLAGVDAIPPGCDDLTVIPHFAGTAMPVPNPSARGAVCGLTLAHTRDHLARAVMEACASMLQECLDPLLDHQIHIDRVRSLGGASRSDCWLQIKADLLGVPVERPACTDAASLGAAMLAATGIGQFSALEDAADAWYRPERVFDPVPAKYSLYRTVYLRYRDIYQRLYGKAQGV